MSNVIRRAKFPNVPNLDNELNYIVKQVNSNIKSRKYGVQLTGQVNGSNQKFFIPGSSYDPASLVIWIDSTRQFSNAYNIGTDKSIIFITAPASGVIRCDYNEA